MKELERRPLWSNLGPKNQMHGTWGTCQAQVSASFPQLKLNQNGNIVFESLNLPKRILNEANFNRTNHGTKSGIAFVNRSESCRHFWKETKNNFQMIIEEAQHSVYNHAQSNSIGFGTSTRANQAQSSNKADPKPSPLLFDSNSSSNQAPNHSNTIQMDFNEPVSEFFPGQLIKIPQFTNQLIDLPDKWSLLAITLLKQDQAFRVFCNAYIQANKIIERFFPNFEKDGWIVDFEKVSQVPPPLFMGDYSGCDFTISPNLQELSVGQLTCVRDLVLENQYGKIIFSEPLNLLGVSLRESVTIKQNLIRINGKGPNAAANRLTLAEAAGKQFVQISYKNMSRDPEIAQLLSKSHFENDLFSELARHIEGSFNWHFFDDLMGVYNLNMTLDPTKNQN